MYYPIQIPYILNQNFLDHVAYTESTDDQYSGFIICFWEMETRSDQVRKVENIVVADGCIDLVVDYESNSIGFSGMSRSKFDFTIKLPAYYCGFRMMPGAFHQLTGLPATAAMDEFIAVETVFKDFDRSRFFGLAREPGQTYLKSFLAGKTQGLKPDPMTMLFHRLYDTPVSTAKELYDLLHLSPRQCQRNFTRYYGITPKMVLSIIRFQRCLELLISSRPGAAVLPNVDGYYDQPHFIKDFKQYIGIRPLELIRHYRT